MSRRLPVHAFGWVMALAAASSFGGPVVPDGLTLTFSPRGQNYFRGHLDAVLIGNKIDLSKMAWDEIKFVENDPFNEKGMSDSLRTIHDALGAYFYGFPINPPKIEVRLANAALTTKFKVVGAAVDPAGPEAYGLPRSNDGVIVVMKLEAEALEFDAETLRLNDLANVGLFGVVGADHFAQALDDRRTINAELPILVQADGKAATLRVLAVHSNLSSRTFDSSFERILTPSITVTINNQSRSFDQAAFEKDLRNRLPEISQEIAKAVQSYLEKGGPALLQGAFDHLASAMNIAFPVSFGGGQAKPDDLKVELHPKRAAYSPLNRLASLSFDAEIADPKANGDFTIVGRSGRSRLLGFDSTKYDVALTLDPAAVNAILNRAWTRGVLKDTAMGKDDSGRPTVVKILEPPTISFGGVLEGDRAVFHAKIGYVVHGLGGVLFKGPIPIGLDLTVKLETNAKNEVEVVMERIDESSLKIDTHAAWLWPIRTKVAAMVRAKVAKLNRDFAAHRTQMISIPTLDTLLSIPIRLKRVDSDAGNLVLLADFEPKP